MQTLLHEPLQFYETLARGMNSDQERPFVCNAPGCSQRFPTEDHLMIHRHKHEMTLKFPSIKNDNMLSDQTPTPTRFLKNCEEVGLFSDLDCSIEQDFCKAQEEEDSKQNIALHGQAGQGQHQQSHARMANHDTSIVIQQALPSPQSSSVITQAPSTNRQIGGPVSSLPRGHHTCRLLQMQLTHRDVPCFSQGAWLKSEETVALKTKRADFAAAFLRGRMVAAGGLGHEPSALDTVEAFNPQKKKWERLAPMNFPRCSASSIVIRDRLLVVGGVNQVPSSAHEILYVKEEECL